MNNNIDNYVAGAMSEKNAAQSSALQQYQQLAAQMMQERNNQLIQDAQESEAEYDSYYDQLVSDYLSGNPDFDVQTVKQYLDMGLIDQSRYDKFMEQYNESTKTSLQSILNDSSISQAEKSEALNNAMADAKLSDDTKSAVQEMFKGTVSWENGITLTSQNLSDFLDSERMLGKTYRIEGNGIAAEDLSNRFEMTSPYADNYVDVGVGAETGKAGNRFKSIKEAALNEQLANGTVVDFNYGTGGAYYVFLDGRFYELTEI